MKGVSHNCLAHTRVSGMSKDMVQPCRCFSKLIGPEDTSSTDKKLFRETQLHLLLSRRSTQTQSSRESTSPTSPPALPLFGLGSLVVIRLQIQQEAKPAAGSSTVPCQTSVYTWAIKVSQRFICPLLGYMKIDCCGSHKCLFRHFPGLALCTKPGSLPCPALPCRVHSRRRVTLDVAPSSLLDG